MSFQLYRRLGKDAQLLEFRCVTFTEEFLYGTLAKKGSFVKKGSEAEVRNTKPRGE